MGADTEIVVRLNLPCADAAACRDAVAVTSEREVIRIISYRDIRRLGAAIIVNDDGRRCRLRIAVGDRREDRRRHFERCRDAFVGRHRRIVVGDVLHRRGGNLAGKGRRCRFIADFIDAG